MAITAGMTTSFKIALLDAEMDFSADTSQVFKIALFTSSADLNTTTTAYSTTGESSGSGYTAGGATLTVSTNPTSSGTIAYLDFSDVTWSSVSLTARGALIYKADGVTDPSIVVLDFGTDIVRTGADFTVEMPPANAMNAIVRIN